MDRREKDREYREKMERDEEAHTLCPECDEPDACLSKNPERSLK